MTLRSSLRLFWPLTMASLSLNAEPFSKDLKIDFFRDVASRDLSGLATQSDGRLLAGPVWRPLAGDLGVDLVWDLEPLDEHKCLIGSGPDGKIIGVSIDREHGILESKIWSDLEAGQVFVLKHLPNGQILAGTSPRATVYLLNADGSRVTSISLAADSVFDLLPVDGGTSVLAATGNPGRIYRIDLAKLVASDPTEPLANRGVTEFGRIRDRNVRRLLGLQSGQVLAGSSPDGNVYRFEAAGGDPLVLFDQERAEVTDLIECSNGDVYASLVTAPTDAKTRVSKSTSIKSDAPTPPEATDKPDETATIMEPAGVDPFVGRSSLILFPGGDGLPETVMSRSNLAIYRIASQGDLLILGGGDSGELTGYDRSKRRAITFAGSSAAQITDLDALPTDDGWLALTNNPSGLAIVDLKTADVRSAKTRRIDLRTSGRIGAIRLGRLREVDSDQLTLEMRVNRGRDEIEGWSPWTPALLGADGGWRTVDPLTGQYVQLRLRLPTGLSTKLQIDDAQLFHLPQNRRPVLQSFRIVSPGFGLLPQIDKSPPPNTTLGQIINASSSGGENASKRSNSSLMASPVVPELGAQIVTWSISDADDDELSATFSIRRDQDPTWIELAANITDSWLQFDRRTLPDGTYFTRLVVTEKLPRRPEEQQTVTFETDNLLIDQTPPQFDEISVSRETDGIRIVATASDSLSLLVGVELVLNNGQRVTIEQPVDGILDGRAETFEAILPPVKSSGATAVELRVSDAQGNLAARRVPLP